MPEVITFGEPLILLAPELPGPLRHVDRFRKSVVGAELNFAIGVSRLGLSSGWFGRVGQDEFGAQVVACLRSEGVDTSRVRFDAEAPTAVMFKEHRGVGEPRVIYYRKHSAASRTGPEDLDELYLRGARLLHVTGITPALSDSCLRAVHEAVGLARRAGVTVSFDPNIRLKLMGRDRVQELLLPLVEAADLLLLGLDEGEVLFGVSGPDEVVAAARARGSRVVAVKLGDEGAIASDGTVTVRRRALAVPKVVDTVGAGDGFDAGFVAGYLRGSPLETCLHMGTVVGGCAVTVMGDYEGYPTWLEAEQLMGTAPPPPPR
ncbi:MAG TPA: sugar kinase [Symbiobacteriaceae bacterium]|nr:sugar kinase [Symbiobacteriaceae bacterium]